MSASNCPRGTARPARRLMFAALPIAAIVGLAGCSAGQLAETSQIRSAVDGVAGNVGDISVRDASFAAPTGNSYDAGASLPLNLTVVNGSLAPDEITAATVEGQPAEIRGATDSGTSASGDPSSSAAPSTSSSAQPSGSNSSTSASNVGAASASPSMGASVAPAGPLPASTIALPAQKLVSIGEDATIVLPQSPKQYYPSQLISVTITFKNAGVLSLMVPIGVPMDQQPTNSSSDFNFHTGGE